MGSDRISRRAVLKGLGAAIPVSALATNAVAQMPAMSHEAPNGRSERATGAPYKPQFFNAEEYATLSSLCDAIIPPDEHGGGAVAAGAPEYIDRLTSENEEYQELIGGGILWLNATCQDRFGTKYLACSAAQKKEILDLIAYSANRERDASLGVGINFFAQLRRFAVDGFFTSKIGIRYVKYVGNTFVPEFPGCPPLPDQNA